VVEQVLAVQPKVVGFGVYIWNVVQTEKVISLLKTVAPEVVVVLGGPEVSYENESQKIVEYADFIITGWGEVSFRQLMLQVFDGEPGPDKIIAGQQPKLDQISMPYHLYNEDDIKNRLLYVEASRGCPFKCEFCLSALDKTAWPFDLDEFLQHMASLMSDDLFLHFEVIPDHLPEALKDMIVRFPAGSLQFEIGIQTFNPEVQTRISRRQDNAKAIENLRWIRQHSEAYIHADLIFGLPGETMESFAASFDQLVALTPHEIQVGILKRLKGSPIIRHTDAYQLKFNPNPPYSIASSDTVSFTDVQFMNRFARYWDLIGNSGHFKNTLGLLLGEAPFIRFSELTRALFERSGQTHKISLLRLYDLIYEIGLQTLSVPADEIIQAIYSDHSLSGLKSQLKCLGRDKLITSRLYDKSEVRKNNVSRQSRHK